MPGRRARAGRAPGRPPGRRRDEVVVGALADRHGARARRRAPPDRVPRSEPLQRRHVPPPGRGLYCRRLSVRTGQLCPAGQQLRRRAMTGEHGVRHRVSCPPVQRHAGDYSAAHRVGGDEVDRGRGGRGVARRVDGLRGASPRRPASRVGAGVLSSPPSSSSASSRRTALHRQAAADDGRARRGAPCVAAEELYVALADADAAATTAFLERRPRAAALRQQLPRRHGDSAGGGSAHRRAARDADDGARRPRPRSPAASPRYAGLIEAGAGQQPARPPGRCGVPRHGSDADGRRACSLRPWTSTATPSGGSTAPTAHGDVDGWRRCCRRRRWPSCSSSSLPPGVPRRAHPPDAQRRLLARRVIAGRAGRLDGRALVRCTGRARWPRSAATGAAPVAGCSRPARILALRLAQRREPRTSSSAGTVAATCDDFDHGRRSAPAARRSPACWPRADDATGSQTGGDRASGSPTLPGRPRPVPSTRTPTSAEYRPRSTSPSPSWPMRPDARRAIWRRRSSGPTRGSTAGRRATPDALAVALAVLGRAPHRRGDCRRGRPAAASAGVPVKRPPRLDRGRSRIARPACSWASPHETLGSLDALRRRPDDGARPSTAPSDDRPRRRRPRAPASETATRPATAPAGRSRRRRARRGSTMRRDPRARVVGRRRRDHARASRTATRRQRGDRGVRGRAGPGDRRRIFGDADAPDAVVPVPVDDRREGARRRGRHGRHDDQRQLDVVPAVGRGRFSSEYYTAPQEFLVREDSGIDDARRPRRPDGVRHGRRRPSPCILTPHVPDSQLLPVKDPTECLVAIQEGEADAYFGHDSFLYGHAAAGPDTSRS